MKIEEAEEKDGKKGKIIMKKKSEKMKTIETEERE